jgi:hypothetical protein
MKIRLFFTFIICFLILSICNAFSQTATFAALTGGLQSGAITNGQSQVVLIGFSANVTGGSITFTQFNINWTTASTSQSHLANGTLYRCPTSTFNASTSTPVGNVTFSGSNITVNSLNETISGSTNYYFLVADAVYSSGTTDYNGQIYINTATFAVDNNSNSYAAWISDYIGYVFNSGSSPYPVVVANNTTGLTSTATTLTAASSGVALFGFSVTTTANTSFTAFEINSNLSNLSTYFTTSKFQLWSGTTAGFANASNTGATATVSGSYVQFNKSLAVNKTTKYFYLVATPSGLGTFPATVQFNLGDGQSSSALTTSSTTYNNFTATGNIYNMNGTTVTVTSAQNGVLTNGTTMSSGQTGMALFGFGISAASTISVTGFNINSTLSNTASYFGNGRLYSNTSNTFTGSTQVTGATVTFSGSYANVTFGTAISVTTTTKYYFLVADNAGAAPTSGITVAFNFTSGQSQSAVTQTGSSYNTFNITGNTYTLPPPFLTVTGENSTTTNGITSGNLVYGQTNIVLFGFGVTAGGAPYTLNTFNIKTSGGENGYFSNARLYRSTTAVFPGGTPLYTAALSGASPGVFISGGGYFNCNVTETIPAGTTYYYWLVADYTVNFGSSGSFTCSFASGQAEPAFISNSPYSTYNTFNVTGNSFNIVTSEYWIGAISGDLTNALNFQALNGGNGTVPVGTSIVLNIGGIAYTHAPSITASGTTTLGGVTFGSAVSNPTLTIASGSTLNLTSGLVVSNPNATISGGTVTLASTGTSSIGASSLLTLSNTTLNVNGALNVVSGGTVIASGTGSVIMGTGGSLNVAGSVTIGNALTVNQVGTSASPTLTGAGNINIAPAATLNVNSGDVLYTTLTGKLTLKSDSTGSASVGQITATSIAGPGADSIRAERFITGGLGHRGYYLLSSPVYAAAVSPNNVYDLHYLIYGGMYLTGATGFDKAGNPSLYFYREDQIPTNTTFTGGNFWGVSTFNNTNPYDYNLNGQPTIYNLPVGNGFMVFFRGARSAGTLADETTTGFLTAPTVTLSSYGTLNAGQIVVRDWFTPSSANLSYTTTIDNASVRGFNLVGNPYASSIDWETYNTTSATTGIYASNISNTVYEYNILTHNYDTYQVGGGYTNEGTNTIVSGQGFFVQANGASPELIFNESAKTSTQNTGATLFMSTRAAVATAKAAKTPDQHLRLQLFKDSVNKDNIYVSFNAKASLKYVLNEDALYIQGTGQVNFASFSSDHIALAINKLPLPTTKSDTISLRVNATATGAYSLNMLDVTSLSTNYEVWLMDANTKDSVNMRQTASYPFNINLSDTTTYGSRRFSLIIRENPGKKLRLVDFDAAKVSKGVQLTWTTKNELNTTIFTVERSVDKGITFSPVGGFTSSSQGTYSLMDNDPLNGTDEYRLKLMDIDGNITYSAVQSVNYLNSTSNTNNIIVYPNPVKTILNVIITPAGTASGFTAELVSSLSSLLTAAGKADRYSITIVNNLGAVVKTAQTNQLIWQTDVSRLMPGTYVVQVVSKSGKGITGQTTFIKL